MLNPQRGTGFTCAEVYYPQGDYEHPPAGVLEIRVVRRGSSRAAVDLGAGRRPMFTRPGDILLSLPNRATSFSIEDGRTLTLVTIEPATALRIMAARGAASLDELAPLLAKPVRDSMLAELCRRIEQDDDEDSLFATSALVVVLLSLLAKARDIAAVVPAPALSRLQVARATAFVDAHLDEPVSAHDVAAELHMKAKRFSRAFRHATGLPVYQFILRRRTELAFRLLRETGLPLAEIALRAGFSHQAHMTRMLSRLRGETPKQIRAKTQRPT